MRKQVTNSLIIEQVRALPLKQLLERVHTVLKRYGAQYPDGVERQKELLKNINHYSWRYDGLYYATEHNGELHCDEALKLINFSGVQSGDNPSYNPRLDGMEQPKGNNGDKIANYLRFVSQQPGVSKEEFNVFKENITKYINDKENKEKLYKIRNLLVGRFLVNGCPYTIKDIEKYFSDEGAINIDIADDLQQWFTNNTPLEDSGRQHMLSVPLEKIPKVLSLLSGSIKIELLNGLTWEQSQTLINRTYQLYQKANSEQEVINTLKDLTDNQEVEFFLFSPSLYKEFKEDKKTYNVHPFLNIKNILDKISFISTPRREPLKKIISLAYLIDDSVYESLATEDKKDVDEILKFFSGNLGLAITEYEARADKLKRILGKTHRPLKSNEKNELAKRLGGASHKIYKSTNQKLFAQLIEHLAINNNLSDAEVDANLTRLTDYISKIGDKKYYNDIGNVLGVLLAKASTPEAAKSYLSLTHVNELLSLIEKANCFGNHFASELMATVLNYYQQKDDNDLFNADINKLSRNVESSIYQALTDILTTKEIKSKEIISTLSQIVLDNPTNLLMDSGYQDQTAYQHLKSIFKAQYQQNSDMAIYKDFRHYFDGDRQIAAKNWKILLKIYVDIEKAQLSQQKLPLTLADIHLINKVWQQAKRSMLSNDQIPFNADMRGNDIKNKIILCLLMNLDYGQSDKQQRVNSISSELQELDEIDLYRLTKLAFTTKKIPVEMIEGISQKKVDDFCENYKKSMGDGLRKVTLSSDDEKNIDRVLDNSKEKRTGRELDSDQKACLKKSLIYVNHYSKKANLKGLSLAQLKSEIEINQINILNESKNSKRQSAINAYKMNILAIMREVMVRNTGKWVNDTQMLTLIRAAVEGGSTIYQMKTGEGKSILTTMRSAYIALTGQAVDVFSAKESLSMRDHAEFEQFFADLGIATKYIAPTSTDPYSYGETDVLIDPDKITNPIAGAELEQFLKSDGRQIRPYADNKHYSVKQIIARINEVNKPLLEAGEEAKWTTLKDVLSTSAETLSYAKGSVNYATIGGMSIYQANQEWTSTPEQENEKPKLGRVAFIDEVDHVLREEDTMFNYVDGENAPFYNADDWVYQEVYQFYLDCIKGENRKEMTTNAALQRLCQRLQDKSEHASVRSKFMERYIDPAFADKDISDEKRALARNVRNNQLLKLLIAAKKADQLVLDNDFCVVEESQKVSATEKISVRKAKVVIKNQVQHGSTYSESVHQLLHARLNKEAAEKGQPCNFFTDPEPDIVLSYNTEFVLNDYYCQREGCTGTAGDKEDMGYYSRVFGIDSVLKIPTHKPVSSTAMQNVYAEGIDSQAEEIAKAIVENDGKGPILITCENDSAVKALFDKVEKILKGKEFSLIKDTNDSGKTENELLSAAGKKRSVTFSSRMGRGTDIKPEGEQGLYVIRTYIDIARIVKQERGRQGRNGSLGTFREIIDKKSLTDKIGSLGDDDKAQFDELFKQEEAHLQKKLEKHKKASENKSNFKWSWLTESSTDGTVKLDEKLSKPYLQARALQRFYYKKQKEERKYRYCRDFLISKFSKQFVDHLATPQFLVALNEHPSLKDEHKRSWRNMRKQLEQAWNTRLIKSADGDPELTEEQGFKIYMEKCKEILTSDITGVFEEYFNGEGINKVEQLANEWFANHADQKNTMEDRPSVQSDRSSVEWAIPVEPDNGNHLSSDSDSDSDEDDDVAEVAAGKGTHQQAGTASISAGGTFTFFNNQPMMKQKKNQLIEQVKDSDEEDDKFDPNTTI